MVCFCCARLPCLHVMPTEILAPKSEGQLHAVPAGEHVLSALNMPLSGFLSLLFRSFSVATWWHLALIGLFVIAKMSDV